LNNQEYIPDKTDRRIIGILAGNSRLSYEKIGSALNLTRNSIKARIKRMVFFGIIQEYITDVNFALLGYNIYYIFTKQEEKSNKNSIDSRANSRKSILKYLDRLGDIIAEIEVLGETSIFRVATRNPLTDEEITENHHNNTTVSSLPGSIDKVVLASTAKGFRYQVHKHKQQKQSLLTSTDLKLLRCLILNPQIGIADVADLTSVSARTATRILNKLIDYGVIRFSIICNPSLMKGFVVFGLLIYINENNGSKKIGQEKFKMSNSHKVLERLYSESQEYPFLRTPIVSHDNIIILSVFGNDVFAIDSMLKRTLSFDEVKKVELYVFTRIKYYKESIVKEIDHILS
jgi:DNA-binding Lrp family transcriptional regulator